MGSTMPATMILAASPAVATTNSPQWQFEPATSRLEMALKEGVTPRYFLVAEPARIVVDLPTSVVATKQTQQTFTGSIRQVRVSQFQPGVVRIVLELAPGVVLAQGQVKLEKVGQAQRGQTRWVLRPLLAKGNATPEAKPAAVKQPVPQGAKPKPDPKPAVTQAPIASPTDSKPAPVQPPSVVAPADSLPVGPRPASPAIAPTAPVPPDPINTPLPPKPDPVTVPDVPPVSKGSDLPDSEAIAILPPAPSPDDNPVVVPPAVPAESTKASDIPSTQPIARSNPPQVSVPGIGAAPSLTTATPMPPTGDDLPTAIPPQISGTVPGSTSTPTVQVPPVSDRPQETAAGLAGTNASTSPLSPQASAPPVVEFGKPLPNSSAPNVVPPIAPASAVPKPAPMQQAILSSTILPRHSVLTLIYPGQSPLKLEADKPRQEVLLLQAAIYDSWGRLVLPEGSQVTGRFESDRKGSRFIAQAISVNGQIIPLLASSDSLSGMRQTSDRNLILNSGIGAAAGLLLGGLGGLGLLAGAAGGAAFSFATAPRPATIQPGQLIQIRLEQDLR